MRHPSIHPLSIHPLSIHPLPHLKLSPLTSIATPFPPLLSQTIVKGKRANFDLEQNLEISSRGPDSKTQEQMQAEAAKLADEEAERIVSFEQRRRSQKKVCVRARSRACVRLSIRPSVHACMRACVRGE